MICQELFKNNYSAILIPMDGKDIDRIMGQNLKRLRLERKLSQDDLAAMIGETMTKQRLSALENGREGIGQKLLARLCDVMDAQLWEFSFTDGARVIKDEQELRDIKQRREANRLGIGNRVREAEAIWIETARRSAKEPDLDDMQARLKKGLEEVSPAAGKKRHDQQKNRAAS